MYYSIKYIEYGILSEMHKETADDILSSFNLFRTKPRNSYY